MGVSKNKHIAKKPKSKVIKSKKFEVMFGHKPADFVILGRSPFGTGAKKIKVNQDASKGAVEDRRHILHYDEVLKPTIERVIRNLLSGMNGDKVRVSTLVGQRLTSIGIKRLPKTPEKIVERLVTEMNSAPDNLIPDRADTNKAIEVVRGYLRSYIKTLSTPEFAEEAHDNNPKRMQTYKELAKNTFIRDATGGDITAERNRMHGEILEFIDGCQGPAELWNLLHELLHSATFDFSPKITRDSTTKAIAWQKTMSLNEDSDPTKQLDDMLMLIS